MAGTLTDGVALRTDAGLGLSEDDRLRSSAFPVSGELSEKSWRDLLSTALE